MTTSSIARRVILGVAMLAAGGVVMATPAAAFATVPAIVEYPGGIVRLDR